MINRIRTAMSERDKGFTLIELLVVIIVIGILAAIAIPVFLNQRKKGVEASIKSDLKNAATAIETYTADNPSWVQNTQTQDLVAQMVTDYKPSPGNYIHLRGVPGASGVDVASAATGYCIVGYNETDMADFFLYDSRQGGLLDVDAGERCN